MVFFKGQHSPRGYDELGHSQAVDRESDLNPAWENQRMTYQQFVRTFDGTQEYEGVPGAVAPGALVDKDPDRGVRATSFNQPLMTGSAALGAMAISYMLLKAMVH